MRTDRGPMITSASTEAPEIIDFVPTTDQIEAQVDFLIDRNEEAFYMFDGELTINMKREPSKYFGPISSLELRQIQYRAEATPEQCKAACMEIRQRFIDSQLDYLTYLAEKNSD